MTHCQGGDQRCYIWECGLIWVPSSTVPSRNTMQICSAFLGKLTLQILWRCVKKMFFPFLMKQFSAKTNGLGTKALQFCRICVSSKMSEGTPVGTLLYNGTWHCFHNISWTGPYLCLNLQESHLIHTRSVCKNQLILNWNLKSKVYKICWCYENGD